MRKTILAATGITLMLAATAMGQAGQQQQIRGKNFFNYAFPSSWNPKGVPANQVTQLISITWDDNQYSGANGSYYESAPGQGYSDVQRINGDGAPLPAWSENPAQRPGVPNAMPVDTWTKNPNALNIFESGSGKDKIGLAWAFENLGKDKQVPMTFNMITGLYVNVWSDGTHSKWDNTANAMVGPYGASQNYQSDLGYWTGQEMGEPWNDTDYWPIVPDGKGFNKVPIAWGREMGVGLNASASEWAQQNFITEMTKKIMQSTNPKHEIGNHTIDHMETNTILGDGRTAPRQGKPGFARITSGTDSDVSQLGKGMTSLRDAGANSDGKETMPWGIVIDQKLEYGTKNHALVRGWGLNVGRWMEKDVWKRYIQLSEDWLTKTEARATGGLGMQKNNIWGFRTPRLEVNSNLYYGLKELEYIYDCGLEEGYEAHVNGKNFLWPYTMDNGIRNSWTKTNIGERVFVDSTPTGFWQFPVNCLIVPGEIRPEVVANWNSINKKLPTYEGADHTPAGEWDGKVTGFDFNAWVLYGMSKENFLKTMKYTTDRRIDGNRSPFQYGAHTDYYTPIYDNGTLLNSFNRPNFGQSIDNGWNTWKIRQQGTEEWVDYAKGKSAVFVTAIDMIDSLQKWSQDNWIRGTSSQNLNASDFELYVGENRGNGTLADYQNVALMAAAPDDDQPTFVYSGSIPDNLTHIELSYRSRTATAVRIVMNNGTVREALLAHRYSPIGHYDGNPSSSFEANLNDMRNSGKIPLTSFDFPADHEGDMDYSSINPSDISHIEIAPLAPRAKLVPHGQVTNTAWWTGGATRTENFELKFKIEGIKLWTGSKFDYQGITTNPSDGGVSIAKVNTNGRTLSLAGVSKNALKLNVAQSGKYNVSVFAANGRLLQSFSAQNLSAGVNTLKLNNLAKGVYMIKVQGIDTKQQLTKSALVM